MNGQVQVRHEAATRTDCNAVRGAAICSAAYTSVPVSSTATIASGVKGQGRHRADTGRETSAVRRVIAAARSLLTPYRSGVPTSIPTGEGGATSSTAVPESPETVSVEMASLYGHSVYVPGGSASVPDRVPAVRGTPSTAHAEDASERDSAVRVPRGTARYLAADTELYVSASGAAHAVASEHSLIAYRRATQHWARAGSSEYAAAPSLVDASVGGGDIRPVHGGSTASTSAADQSRAAELQWRAEWLKSRQANAPQQESSDQIIVRQNPSVPSTVGR